MVRALLILASTLLSLPAWAAVACTEQDLDGPYGLQLSGQTTISGTSAPAVVLVRLVFDGDGGVTGYSSVNFNGLLLSNPVTGTYDVQSDCTLSLSLQDDSGAWQHFAGKVTSRGGDLHQTDPGTGVRGPMLKAKDECKPADFLPRYAVTLSGTSTPLATGGEARAVSGEGTITATGSGRLNFKIGTLSGDGTFDVQPDCIVNLELNPSGTDTKAMGLRGIMVNGGKDILAIETDPGESVAAHFRAR
jgi:hypothetical protein